jgi:sulfur carrier protein
MYVLVNGSGLTLPQPSTLAELLRTLQPAAPFAAARNDELVPRAGYEQCVLAEGDRIDILHPAAGG